MYHLIYTSSASHAMTENDLVSLLNQSRERNKRQNITGMLLYANQNFYQVLEGNKSDVDMIYQAIINDERNHGNIIILKGHVETRSFPNWAMGFANMHSYQSANLEGFSDFMTAENGELAKHPDLIMRLLLQFKENADDY